MSALLANYLYQEPKAASIPESAGPVIIRLAIVALAIATVLALSA